MHAITDRTRTITVVTIISAAVNTGLAILKMIIGYWGHSQALIADGVHSLSDLITDALVLLTSHMGAQSPDRKHPYGHRRIETIGTILLALIVMLVGAGIAYDSVHQLLEKHHQQPHWPVILVALFSVVLNEGLYYYALAKNKKIQSDLLRSNAWHHRSDAWISIIVLISALGARFHWYFLDAIGAFIIAAVIFYMGFKMICESLSELIDASVDEETLEDIKKIILNVPGVLAIHQLRTRSHSSYIFVDVHIQVDPHISVSEGHYISEQVLLDLTKMVHQVQDVTVHIDPENDERAQLTMHLPSRTHIEQLLKSHWAPLPAYAKIRRTVFHYLHGQLHIEVYLPREVLQTYDPTTLTSLYQQAAQPISPIATVTIYYE